MEIDSEEENRALVDEINRRGFTERKMHFWMGLTDLERDGDWRLTSNGLKPSYLNWHKGEPDNLKANQDCARLRIGPVASWKDTWGDLDCNRASARNGNHPMFSLHALCEFGPLHESSSTEGGSVKSETRQKYSMNKCLPI